MTGEVAGDKITPLIVPSRLESGLVWKGLFNNAGRTCGSCVVLTFVKLLLCIYIIIIIYLYISTTVSTNLEVLLKWTFGHSLSQGT